MDKIEVRGARTHNLKNFNLSIPRDKLVVITGLSGSGKSSLAFDTLYAEGQRRYVESLSAYARQFLSLMEKPDVDGIEGLSPAISIEQKSTSHNPRSTVGTITEIYDYLRYYLPVWANLGAQPMMSRWRRKPFHKWLTKYLPSLRNQNACYWHPLYRTARVNTQGVRKPCFTRLHPCAHRW